MVSPWHLRRAARTLRGGGVVAYPTEAVYGLGCDPVDRGAFVRLLALKRRALGKGVILLAASAGQIEPLLARLDDATRRRVLKSWPGFVTWVVPAPAGVPWWLTGGRGSLAVRVTAHPVAAALCRAFGGPVVSTSANRSGRPPARSALAVRRALPRSVDYLLVGDVGGESGPSEIRDALTGRTLRPRTG